MKVFRFLFGVLLLKSMAYLCVPPAVAQEIIITDPATLDVKDIIKPGDSIPTNGNDTDLSGGDTSTTAIAQIRTHKAPKVYPNPAQNEIHVISSSADIRIYSSTGKLVALLKGSKHLTVDYLPRGVYIVRDEFGASTRLILQ